MNKNRKIAMAVVATVMAGTMVIPLAACNKDEDKGPKVDLSEYAWNVFNADGSLNYDAYERETPVTLNLSVGYDGKLTSTSFASGSTYTLADGKTYYSGDMKPAWVQMGEDLNITWNDKYNNAKTSANLTNLVSGSGGTLYKDVDIFTTDLSVAVARANAGTDILNLADYLDYMPNFKNFLESNPIVYLSLLQDGMKTEGETAGQGQKLYVAPYFDGNDDIERYCIIRQDWTTLLLNGTTALTGGETFKANCSGTAYVQPFMTDLETLAVDITLPTPDADGEYTSVGKLYKNYANVKDQINSSDTALNTAYLAASGKTSASLTSGNIVAIMNDIIAANPEVTGSQLVAVFRAYIDACYTKTAAIGAESYYSASNRADLFNGYDAAWDVDDLVAMLRCVMTNQNTLLSTDDIKGKRTTSRKIYGIAPRMGTNDRTPDMVRLACQLYGVRGGDSRYEYTYIDNDGVLHDARNDAEFYQAMANLNLLRQEGLVVDYSGTAEFKNDTGYVVDASNDKNSSETFMMYDFCQTQTLNGFYASQGASGKDMPRGYNFAPILTPVSKWNVDGDDEISTDEYFRFTESWRSVKTSGIALNGALAYSKDKLIAALQFVDYLYSEDGQIVSTYGPMAKNAEGEGGFWYNEEQTDPQETENADGTVTKNYFTYRGKKYAGTSYKGKITPTITTAVYNSFMGKTGSAIPNGDVADAKFSFTNYARYLIGSTLPLGVKDQSFENQLTSTVGKNGSAKVGAALANKTESGYTVVRGMTLKVNPEDYWYTCVPTGLPISSANVKRLNNSNMNNIKYMSGEAKKADDKQFISIFNYIILQGISGTFNEQGVSYNFSGLDKLVSDMSGTYNAETRENLLATGWTTALTYWNYLKPAE